jgi:hypothetical protein
MGHYMDIGFDVVLNELGKEIVSRLYETRSWMETVMSFPKIHPSVFAGITDKCDVVPFSPHSSLKEGVPSSEFDQNSGRWKVQCMFKWRHSVDDVISNFLQYVIEEPSTITIEHDLYEKPVIKNLTPIKLEKE